MDRRQYGEDDRGLDGRTILHVVPALDEGRVPRMILALVEAISRVGGRPVVAAEKGRLVGELQARGGEWVAFDPGTWNPAAAIGNIAHLRGLFDREAVDLVHVHADVRLPALSGVLAGRFARIPVVTSFYRAPSDSLGGRLMERSLYGARVMTAPSRYLAGVLKERSPKRADRVVAVSPGLELQPFDPDRISARARAEFRAVAGLDGSERVIVQQARFNPDKGQIVLIDAARLLVNGGLEGTVFLIVCDGPDDAGYRALLDARIEAQGLNGVVRLVGTSEAGPAALAAAHLAVAPSVAPDPVGRSAIEALAMGLPLVATGIGALGDLVVAPPDVAEDDRIGFRVQPGDAMALAQGIGQALELSPRARIAMAGRASAYARRFGRARMQDQMVAIYRRVLAAAG